MGSERVVIQKKTQKEKKESVLEPPRMYRVILLNDDYTPMDFVVSVLMVFFNKSQFEATNIMQSVHQQGRGQCGIYTKDVAETKVAQVNEFSRHNEYPLLCVAEQE